MTLADSSRIAVPLIQNRFSTHYGQTTSFALFNVDRQNARVLDHRIVPVPGTHVCGMADWLKSQGVDTVIVGGIGAGAVAKLQEAQIQVLAAPAIADPAELVQACLCQTLPAATANCSHGHGEGHDHQHGHDHAHGGSCHEMSSPR